MKKTLLTILITFAIISNTKAQTTYYVNADASGTSDGSSWVNADTSLFNALNSISSNTQVWVARG